MSVNGCLSLPVTRYEQATCAGGTLPPTQSTHSEAGEVCLPRVCKNNDLKNEMQM